jgi:hypothetical protein
VTKSCLLAQKEKCNKLIFTKISMAEITLDAYKKAYRQLSIESKEKGFIAHAIGYAVINSILIGIDLMTGSGLWFYWPLGGWDAGLASHYYFGVHRANKNLDEYEIRAERRVSEA